MSQNRIGIIANTNDPTWTYADVDDDRAAMFTAVIPGVGAGVYLRTSERGCSIAAADVEDFITAVRATLARVQDAGAVSSDG